MAEKIYLSFHNTIFDKIIKKKRIEIIKIIENEINSKKIYDCVDIGTTSDTENESSNFIVKNIQNLKKIKSFSNQYITDSFFCSTVQGSITEQLSQDNIEKLKSDVVLSSATIEHVGSREKQKNMIKNISLLSKKFFIITTPNKNYPIDFHTKLPLINMLPNNIFRKILKLMRFEFFSKEENLNLISYSDIKNLINESNINEFFNIKIKYIRLLFFKSNFIIIGRKK